MRREDKNKNKSSQRGAMEGREGKARCKAIINSIITTSVSSLENNNERMVCVPYIVDRAKPRKIVNVEITVKRSSNDGSFHHILGKFGKDNMNREHESRAERHESNCPYSKFAAPALIGEFVVFFFFCSRGHLCRHVGFAKSAE